MCFSKPAFLAASSVFVLLELDANRDRGTISNFGLRLYPGFAVVGARGQLKIPPGGQITDIVRGKPPAEAATVLMSFHYRSWLEAKRTPPSADVVIAQLALLRAYGEDEKHDQWLAAALKNRRARPEDINCLRVYRALNQRSSGDLTGGLAALGEVAPTLTFREAGEEESASIEHAVAPLIVGREEVVYGVISSRADARLTANALAWLAGIDGDIPAPDGLDAEALATGAVSLAAALNRPGGADPWLTALGATADTPARAFAEALVISANGRPLDGARRLLAVMAGAPQESFAPSAGVLAYERAKAAGDAELARQCAQLVTQTYGPRLPAHLRARLEGA